MSVPNVNINVINNIVLRDDATGTALIIGTASWGPTNKMYEYVGSGEINTLYKSGNLVDSSNFGVLGGLQNIKVYRIATDDKEKATYSFQSSAVNRITINGKYHGTYGNNIQVTIEEITAGYLRVLISDGLKTEIFDNEGEGYTSNSDIVDAINDTTTGSNLVDAVLDNDDVLVDDYTATSLAGGDDGDSGLVANDYVSAVNSLIEEDYDYLLTPDVTEDATHRSIAVIIESREINYKRPSIYIVGADTNESYATTLARTATTNRGRLFFYGPGTIRYSDTSYSGNVAGAPYLAGLLSVKQKGDSLTHDSFGLDFYVSYTDSETYTKYYTKSQELALVNAGFCVANKIGSYDGIVRAVTRITDTTNSFYEQSVRIASDYIVNNLYDILNPFLGERNTATKRAQIKSLVDDFMDDAVSDEAIVSYESEVVFSSATVVTVNLTVVPVFPINTINGNVTLSLSI
jgi:hypothetical protein